MGPDGAREPPSRVDELREHRAPGMRGALRVQQERGGGPEPVRPAERQPEPLVLRLQPEVPLA